MKKAVLIGKFSKVTGEIGNRLSQFCQVQFCPGNEKILKDMLDMAMPDLFIVIFTGMAYTPEEVFGFLSARCPEIPVIAVGKDEDEAVLSEKGYLRRESVFFLPRPIDLDKIEKCVEKILNPAQPGEELEGAGTGGKQPCVLLVDDSPQLLYTMQTILSRKYKVTFATSGSRAIAAIAKERPDIILLDYEMPVCDGKMTLEMLRADDTTKDIPVIFLTGVADKNHVMKVMKLHPEGYLLKSCTEERLFATIEAVLNGETM